METNENLIAYCGIYCKACQSFTSGKCEGCRGNSEKSSVLYKKCPVKQCCAESNIFTCADCRRHTSTKDCKKQNPLFLRIASWIESHSRNKSIEMIKSKGRAEFVEYMEDKKWVIIKTKDSFFNKSFGKKVNE
jgi:hypothetical protein